MSDSTEKSAYYYRVISLVVDVGTETLRDTFYSKVQKADVAALFATPDVKKEFRELRRKTVLTKIQYDKVTEANPDPDTYDISLLTTLLTIFEVRGITAPSTGWGKTPDASDKSIGANLIRLRELRNEIVGHRKDAQLDDEEFERYFSEVETVLTKIASYVSKEEKKKIKDVASATKTRMLEPLKDREKKLLEVFSQWHKEYSEQNDTKLTEVTKSLENLTFKVDSIVQNFGSIAQKDDIDEIKSYIKEERRMLQQKANYSNRDVEALSQQATTSGVQPTEMCSFDGRVQQTDTQPYISKVANPNAMSEKEILDVSKNIGSEWEQLRIHLDYTKSQSDALKEAYYADLQQMIHEMLKSWHDVVVDCGENPRMLLAAAFVNASSNYAMACKLVPKDQLDKNAVAQPATTERIQQIPFRKFGYDQGFSPYHPGYGPMQISVYGGNNQFGAGSSMAFHNTQSINSSRVTKDVTDPLALPPESTLPADTH